MFKRELKGFIVGVLITALLLTSLAAIASRSETINAFFNNINVAVNGNIVDMRDANGAAVEPFIHGGTTFLPVRAIAEALGQEVNWCSDSNTVFVGHWPDKPARPMPVWNVPFLERNGDFSASQSGVDDYLTFTLTPGVAGIAQASVTYATNAMAREVTGTFAGGQIGETVFRFYDENDNLLHTSPILTQATTNIDFRFSVGNILQIRVEATNSSGGMLTRNVRIRNFRLVTTDY